MEQRPGGLPRWLEAPAAAGGLLLVSPFLLLAAAAVRLTSPGPALFRQTRVGRGGRTFTVYKLRTMRRDAGGTEVTARGDPRVTPFGRLLRRTKLDELPQLWNVVRGEMSLVGPRPEVPRYAEPDAPLWRRVLAVRPGLTDPVTLELRDEEALLQQVEGDREAFYRKVLLPYKLRGYARDLERRTAWTDIAVLARTLAAVFRPRRPPSPEELRRRLDRELTDRSVERS